MQQVGIGLVVHWFRLGGSKLIRSSIGSTLDPLLEEVGSPRAATSRRKELDERAATSMKVMIMGGHMVMGIKKVICGIP